MGTGQRALTNRHVEFANLTRAALADGTCDDAPPFDPSTLDGLPPAARRYLAAALPAGVPLSTTVELDMEGEIKIGRRWLPFTADQILRASVGFVWAPVVGGRVVRFVGADVLGPRGARIEFRLHGRLPFVRGTGPDILRSARGRLAAETVAWLPQALTPQRGAHWVGLDDERAVVRIDAAGVDIEVEVGIDEHGRIRWLGLERWKDSAEPPTSAPFGGSVQSILTTDEGVRIAGSGAVGWDWHTPGEADGLFFRYRVSNARFGSSTATDVRRTDETSTRSST